MIYKKEMLIGGWVAPPCDDGSGGDFINDESFADIKESGINTVYTCHWDLKDLSKLSRSAELAEKYGIKLFVNTDFLGRKHDYSDEQIEKVFDLCRKNKNIVGVYLDEPRASDFARLKESKEKYGFDGFSDDLIFYVNMVPTYADAAVFFGKSAAAKTIKERYEGFLEEYMQTVRPAFLSFDFYPFRHEKGVCDPEYFLQTSVSKKIADKYGIPLWNFIQVTSWNREQVRNTTHAEIMWQVSTSLAYGVTGIQYFCYWTPPDGGGETFRNAMIDPHGERTPSYYYVRDVNRHLKAVGKYFLAAEHVGVMTVTYGDTLAPVPEEDRLSAFGNISSINTDGVIVGCFKLGGKNMYYVVNTSVLDSRSVVISFESKIKFKQVRRETETTFLSDTWGEVLFPGEGILLTEES